MIEGSIQYGPEADAGSVRDQFYDQRRPTGRDGRHLAVQERARDSGRGGDRRRAGPYQSELKQFKKYSPDKDPDPEEEEYWRHETKHSIS